jgi:CRP-like cAMP-binding protein
MALAAAFKSTFRRPQQREKSGISVNERVWRASLALVETFQDLPIAQLAALETHLITVPVCRGEVLVRAGDEADALYLVVSGRFSVEAGGRRVAEVSSGPIGEVAFFANGTRTATVRALRDSIVLKLPRADFTALCEDNPTILRGIGGARSHQACIIMLQPVVVSRSIGAARLGVAAATSRQGGRGRSAVAMPHASTLRDVRLRCRYLPKSLRRRRRHKSGTWSSCVGSEGGRGHVNWPYPINEHRSYSRYSCIVPSLTKSLSFRASHQQIKTLIPPQGVRERNAQARL